MSISEVYQNGWIPLVQDEEGAPERQKGVLDPQPYDDVAADGKPYKAAGKLEGKKAIVTGGDGGIGRSVALLFALEGADLAITYKPEEKEDAIDAANLIKSKTKDTQ